MRYDSEPTNGTKEEKKKWYRFVKLLTVVYRTFKGQPRKELRAWVTRVCNEQGIDSAEQVFRALGKVWWQERVERHRQEQLARHAAKKAAEAL